MLLLEQLFQLDMDAFAERRMMTPTGGQERTRFFGGVGLDPHSSARVISIAARKTFGCGFGLSFRTADISSSGTNHERKNTLP